MSWRTLLFMGAMGACVPAEIDMDPAGGADVTLTPSAQTTGTPFVTPDGWTMTIHKLVLRVSASDGTAAAGTGDLTGGGYGPWGVLVPTPNCHLRVTGAGAGETASVQVELSQISTGTGTGDTPIAPCGVDAATLKRFSLPSDEALVMYDDQGSPDQLELPSTVIEADAVKGDRHMTLSWAVSLGAISPENTVFITIRANTGVPVNIPINAEMLFIPVNSDAVSMDQIAAADANGDGVVTGVEMAQAQTMCESTDISAGDGGDVVSSGGDDDSSFFCPNLLERLGETNANYLFGTGRSE